MTLGLLNPDNEEIRKFLMPPSVNPALNRAERSHAFQRWLFVAGSKGMVDSQFGTYFAIREQLTEQQASGMLILLEASADAVAKRQQQWVDQYGLPEKSE